MMVNKNRIFVVWYLHNPYISPVIKTKKLMKTIILAIFAAFLTVSTVSAQKIQLSTGEIQLTLKNSDSLSVKQAFRIIQHFTPLGKKWYDQYIIFNGVTYYRPGITFISRKKAFIVK